MREFGIPYQIWKTMQTSDVFLNEMRLVDPLLLHLPRTDFSMPYALHSYDVRDVKLFADAAQELQSA
jgi:hypothetical protein